MKFTILAISLSSIMAAADLGKGLDMYHARKYSEAEKEFQQVLSEDGQNTDAMRYLAMSQLRQGKADDADATLKSAESSARSNNADLLLAHSEVYVNQKRYDDAERAIRTVSEKDPDHAGLAFHRGMLSTAKKEYAPAVKDLEMALEKEPENPYVHYYAGLAYGGIKRPDKMVGQFQEFLRLAPDAPEADRVKSFLRNIR